MFSTHSTPAHPPAPRWPTPLLDLLAGCRRCQQRLRHPRHDKGARSLPPRRPHNSPWTSGAWSRTCCCGPQRQPNNAQARANPVYTSFPHAVRQCGGRSKRFAAAESLRREGVARMPVADAGGRLGAASLPRIARKKLVATGGFEPASSKTSRRRYQLDYETQIRYIVPHILHSAPPLQHLRPCRHRGKHLICRSPALRCLPEMGGWLLAADGCWLTATASCCLLTAGCWQRTATRCSSTKPQTHLCR